jgi:hypothetical protein
VPPTIQLELGKPDKPLWGTEGIKKDDSAVSHGLVCIGLTGVWNWRGTNKDGGKTVLADWDAIALNGGRKFYAAFDFDVPINASVEAALKRFAAFLKAKGADVYIVHIPPSPNGEKVGLDDYLASGGEPGELVRNATRADELPTVADALRSRIAQLAELSELEYETVRVDIAQELGTRVSVLDAQVNGKRLERREHANGSADRHTWSAGSDRSNGCSNEGDVRTIEELEESARPIIDAPDVLAVIESSIGGFGYAGDPLPVMLVYVALASRLTDKPVNAHILAPSASGKNYAINVAVLMMPPEAYVKLSAMSPKALIYGSDDLRHRIVVLSECDSLLNLEGNAATLVRSIIEDGRTDFDVVERDPITGKNLTRRITKDGPTGLVTSGVRELQHEMGTRILNIYLLDTPEQTRRILHAQAKLASGEAHAPDREVIGRLVDYQRWLARQPETGTVVPFASILADAVPAAEVRMRRDFKQLLAIICTIALLNQRHRVRNAEGAIIAELADYEWARKLLLSSFRSIVSGGITDAVRDTCLAVPEEKEFSEADLVKSLGLGKSTIHYRVGRALKGGWLVNLEPRRGYAYRLVRGAPLPDDSSPLPTVERLREQFEQGGCSNGYSNGSETTTATSRSEYDFESSNESKHQSADSKMVF